MPLSEHEERVLREIARQLSEEDPKFVATVANTTPVRLQLRRLRWAIAGFVVGLITLLGLTFQFAFGVIGFALMLASVLFGAGAIRSMGQASGGMLSEVRRVVRGRRADEQQ